MRNKLTTTSYFFSCQSFYIHLATQYAGFQFIFLVTCVNQLNTKMPGNQWPHSAGCCSWLDALLPRARQAVPVHRLAGASTLNASETKSTVCPNNARSIKGLLCSVATYLLRVRRRFCDRVLSAQPIASTATGGEKVPVAERVVPSADIKASKIL